ncbi:MAG TPA: hypothetical protein VM243_12040, partial [Phycisphaerae bacterium]|nr:hypothetical protein [Phycisphaerae bacterium]
MKCSIWAGRVGVVVAMVVCAAVATTANGQTSYTWALGTGDANWNDLGAWGDANAGVYPQITGDVAVFNTAVDAAVLNVSLNGETITVGQIQFLDANAAYTIAPTVSSEVFYLNDANGLAVIQVGDATSWAGFTGQVSLDATTVLADVVGTLNLNGGITGSGLLLMQGGGLMVLGGSNGTTGGLQIDDGTVRVINGAYGSGPVSFGGAGGGVLQEWADSGSADHSSTNVTLLAGAATAQIWLADANGVTDNDVMHKIGDLTFADSNAQGLQVYGFRPETLEITGTVTLNGQDTIENTSSGQSMIMITGPIVGSGALILNGMHGTTGGSSTGGVVLTRTDSNYSGGTYVQGRVGITDAAVLGTGPIHMAGGDLFSIATDSNQADHSVYNVIVDNDSTISPRQGWTGNDLNSNYSWSDANIILVHKFNDLTFSTDSTLTLSTSVYNRVQFMGTTTLNGTDTFSSGTLTMLAGSVTGSGTLRTTGGSTVLLNSTNNHTGGTTIAGGLLGVTSGNLPGLVSMTSGTLVSIAVDSNDADHSGTNISVSGSVTIRSLDGIAPGEIPTWAGFWGIDSDANATIHKWGDLTFTTPATVTLDPSLDDETWFEGTTTLAGDVQFQGSYQNPGYAWTGPYRSYSFRLNGQVTGTGNITFQQLGSWWAGGPFLWLTNDTNDFDGNVTIQTSAASSAGGVVVSAAHGLGTATVYLNSGSLWSVAENDANADHSLNNVVVSSYAYTYGDPDNAGSILPHDTSGIRTRPGIIAVTTMTGTGSFTETGGVIHKFGDLDFTEPNFTMLVGYWNTTSGTLIEFTGTTTLPEGRTYFACYREGIILSGQVTGSGQLVTRNANAGRGVRLTNTGNDYSGGTEVQPQGGYLIADGKGALGTGAVTVFGGYFCSLGADDANSDNSSTNVTVKAGGGYSPYVIGAKTAEARSGRPYAGDDCAYLYTGDPNVTYVQVTHKFGDLTFSEASTTLVVGPRDYWNLDGYFLCDKVEFTGTTTLNGTSTIQADQATILSGQVVGGDLAVAASASGQRYLLLSNPQNAYGDTYIQTSGRLAISA